MSQRVTHRVVAVVGVVLAAAASGCVTQQPGGSGGSVFSLDASALQQALACFGEQEIRTADGGVIHELYACAGTYSAARCRVLRAVPETLILARCTYTVTAGEDVRRRTIRLRCDAPSQDMRRCGQDDELWTEAADEAPT